MRFIDIKTKRNELEISQRFLFFIFWPLEHEPGNVLNCVKLCIDIDRLPFLFKRRKFDKVKPYGAVSVSLLRTSSFGWSRNPPFF